MIEVGNKLIDEVTRISSQELSTEEVSLQIERFVEKHINNLNKDELISLKRYLDDESVIYNTLQMGSKLTLNGIYGALANEHFRFYNHQLAEAITIQGQDAIRFSEDILNDFFKNFHKDVELLKHLKSKCNDVTLDNNPCIKNSVIYMDTDSVDKDSIIRTNKGQYTIENLYNTLNEDAGTTLCGHTSKKGDINILNWSKEKGIYYAKCKRVIKHKVNKPKWRLITSSGKCIFVTNDHSMIVFSQGRQIEVKPSDILHNDKILVYENNLYKYDSVESIKCVGIFNEYVYDIEVDDTTHTFIANDILVHNSCYVQFGEAMERCNWTGSEKDFVLAVDNFRLKKYLEDKFIEYSKKINASKNYLDFELESIAYSGIWLAKKKYIQNLCWVDGISFDFLKKIKGKGIEIIQAKCPNVARKELMKFYIYLFTNFRKNTLEYNKIVSFVKSIKKRYMISDVDDITQTIKMNKYDEKVIEVEHTNDNGSKSIIAKFQPNSSAHLRGGGIYNAILRSNKELQVKYSRLQDGDKVSFYYTNSVLKDKDVFSYPVGNYPSDFAPDVDYDKQFEKTILSPINATLIALKYKKLNSKLKVAFKNIFF